VGVLVGVHVGVLVGVHVGVLVGVGVRVAKRFGVAVGVKVPPGRKLLVGEIPGVMGIVPPRIVGGVMVGSSVGGGAAVSVIPIVPLPPRVGSGEAVGVEGASASSLLL